MEQDFFQGRKQAAPETKAAVAEDDTTQALRLLQENPALAKLIIAALGQTADS